MDDSEWTLRHKYREYHDYHIRMESICMQLNPKSDKLTRITGYELRDALKRTTHLKKTDKGKLTWIDFTPDRDIWRMLVLNNFNIE